MKLPSLNLKVGSLGIHASKKQAGVPLPQVRPQSPAANSGQAPLSVQDIISPRHLEVDFDHIKINNKLLRTLFIAGYPRFVSPAWLDPIINFDHSLDISFFIYPVEGKTVLDDLRRKLAEMEAEISTDIQRGRIVNPGTQAKLDDAQVLQEQLVKGAERFFQFSFYITIWADTKEELNQITKQVESTLGSLLIIAKTATLQAEDALYSTLPFGTDKLSITRNMDTTSLATTFPFTSTELSSDRGILYGINEDNDSLVIFDRFRLENYNSVVFATSGAGKSTRYDELVIYKNKDGAIKLEKIGKIVEKLIKQGTPEKIDDEMEGVMLPEIEVFAFDPLLKGHWSKVTIAARKAAPGVLYKIRTKSGREIVVTSDHNLVILKDGKISTVKGNRIDLGDYVPVPRKINFQEYGQEYLDIKGVLAASRVKSFGVKEGRIGCNITNPGTSIPLILQLNEHFFRVLGYFVSEGSVHPKISQVSNEDAVVLRDVCNYYEAIGLNYSLPRTRGKIRGVCTHSVAFREFLIHIGVGGKSHQKRVPSLVFSTDNIRASAFLRAYFEGDGGVEKHVITTTTKSKLLASGLSYLLLRFGVVARISKKRKHASNTAAPKKNTYYTVTVSGQENIAAFANQIGFVSERKNKSLKELIRERGNTNVDLVPEIGAILKEVYKELYFSTEIPAPKKFSEIKLGIFKPSRGELLKLIKQIEGRVKEIEALETDGLLTLGSLPTLNAIINKSVDKKINKGLWERLGSSWAVTKSGGHPPLLANALTAASVTHNQIYSVSEISQKIYRCFRTLGESLGEFDSSLHTAVVGRSGNTSYNRVLAARDYLIHAYAEKRGRLQKTKEHLAWLKILATSDLFWDPVREIKKIKSTHKYVYDLTVDDRVFLAGFGGMFVHNSFSVKLEAVRSLMLGTEVFIIDPEAEYKSLTEAAGGEFISFSFSSPAKINPFDLAGVNEPGENNLALKILSLHSLFGVIMGQMNESEKAILDRALIATYKTRGITPDPETQKKDPPLMEDLYKILLGAEDPIARSLADRIEKFVKGSFRGIFDQPTNINIRNPLTVFSVKDLEESLRPIAMFIILDFIWTRIRRELKKRILIVDEAWHMMRYPDTAQFLYSIAKRSRKYYLGLTTITQDVEDFLSKDIGKAIVTNSALRLLMKQSPAAIDSVAEVFKLSEGEKQLLLAADVGEGIFFAGAQHVAIRVVASDEEYGLITTKPQDIVAKKEKENGASPQQIERRTPFVVEEQKE